MKIFDGNVCFAKCDAGIPRTNRWSCCGHEWGRCYQIELWSYRNTGRPSTSLVCKIDAGRGDFEPHRPPPAMNCMFLMLNDSSLMPKVGRAIINIFRYRQVAAHSMGSLSSSCLSNRETAKMVRQQLLDLFCSWEGDI
jgi:hypothetical protein